ncbi:MAG: hypothetical protein K8E24_005560 [Methanobacterium paludis]|nr:hypothetical protein [Methanobacterium paludis]
MIKKPDSENEDFEELVTLNEQTVKDKITNNDFNFTGTNLSNFKLHDNVIQGDLNLNETFIVGNVILDNVKIDGKVNLNNAKIDGEVSIRNKSQIHELHMDKICINNSVKINDSKISYFSASGDYKDESELEGWSGALLKLKSYTPSYFENSKTFLKLKNYVLSYFLALFKKDYYPIKEKHFIKSGIYITTSKMGIISVDRLNIGESGTNGIFIDLVNISVYINFVDCNINGDVLFNRATIAWDCIFHGSRIKSGFSFKLSKVKGELDLYKVIFSHPYAQENASREAKRVWNRLGDKDNTDKYFFNEMEAKRQQRIKPLRYTEWFFIQVLLGYGVKSYRVIVAFIGFILVFALLFWLGNGIEGANSFISYFYASTLIALKIGYTGYQPINETYQLLTSIEAIIGAFFWAVAIVIFGKKFMR